MLTRTQKDKLVKLIEEKDLIDGEMAALRKRAVEFNKGVSAICGKEKIDFTEVCKMLAAPDKVEDLEGDTL